MTDSRASLLPSCEPLRALTREPAGSGLTNDYDELRRLARQIPPLASAYLCKADSSLGWIVFLGGTGTGKSTLFNAVCHRAVSATGLERPKTRGAVAFVHRRALSDPVFVSLSPRLQVIDGNAPEASACGGEPGRLTVITHDLDSYRHIAMVDSPDIDSVAAKNRQAAEDVYLLADVVLFVTSQEKYADDVPHRLLQRILRERGRFFLVLNKVDPSFTAEELIHTYGRLQVTVPRGHVWLFGSAQGDPAHWIRRQPAFADLLAALDRTLPPNDPKPALARERTRRARHLASKLERWQQLAARERETSRKWIEQLDQLYSACARDLIRREQEQFAAESRRYLQAEIKKLFRRYDVLAGPRRIIRGVLLAPFRLLGFPGAEKLPEREQALKKMRRHLDLSPIRTALAGFNRSVLDQLSPADEKAPLYSSLRSPDIPIAHEEVEERIFAEQVRLMDWLETTFAALAKGIPKSKEWGIYSTSILWGVLILTLETVVGGGFTAVDAVLDSALAPFVTKGAVELFAYHEIQRIARQLAHRYQEALLLVLQEQRDRYRRCIDELTPSQAAVPAIEKFRKQVLRSCG